MKKAPPSGGKLTSSAMAVQAAKLSNRKKSEESHTNDKHKMSFFARKKGKLAKNLLDTKRGQNVVEFIEQQGETGVDIAEDLRSRSEKFKKYELSKVDVGEQKRLEMLAITSRFNEGLPISTGGTGELHEAVRHNLNNKVIQLLSQAYDVDEMNAKTGYTALMVAAKEKNKAGARLLLDNGAEVRYQNRRGATALHFACRTGEAQIARLILDRAYQCRCVSQLVNIKDTDGRSARDIAQGRGESQLVAKIDAALKEEAAVKAVEDMLDSIHFDAETIFLSHGFRNGSTALHWILENGNMEFFGSDRRQLAANTVKKLVLLGADVNDGDSAGRKPLHYAAMSSGGSGSGGSPNTACARALFRACKKDDAAGDSGESDEEAGSSRTGEKDSGSGAAQSNQIQVDAVDNMGMTAMFFAVERGDIEFTQLLLNYGANIHFIMVPSGFSYLHVCAQRNFGEGCDGVAGEMGEWLVDSEVDHNIVDEYGRTCKMISQDIGTQQSRFVSIIVKAEDDERQRAYRVKSLLAGRQYKS